MFISQQFSELSMHSAFYNASDAEMFRADPCAKISWFDLFFSYCGA